MQPEHHVNAALTGRYEIEREIGAGGMELLMVAPLGAQRTTEVEVITNWLQMVRSREAGAGKQRRKY